MVARIKPRADPDGQNSLARRPGHGGRHSRRHCWHPTRCRSVAEAGARPCRGGGPCSAFVRWFLRTVDGHSPRGATRSSAPSSGQRRWRHRYPVDEDSDLRGELASSATRRDAARWRRVTVPTGRACEPQRIGRSFGSGREAAATEFGGCDAMKRARHLAAYPRRVRHVRKVDIATIDVRCRARLFRLRPAGCQRRYLSYLGCDDVERGSPHPCHHTSCHRGSLFRVRLLTRSRWHLGDHAGGNAGGGRVKTASGLEVCFHHARRVFRSGEGVLRPNRRPPGHRPRSFGFGSGGWVGIRRVCALEAWFAVGGDTARGSTRRGRRPGGSFGGPSSRWRHRSDSWDTCLPSVAARSPRYRDATARRSRRLRPRGEAAYLDRSTMAG